MERNATIFGLAVLIQEKNWWKGFLILIAGLIIGACYSVDATMPRRIVSINVCADQLLLLLAEKSRIASLSYLATDPHSSPLADLASGIPLNYGQAEEVLMLKPDLVLASVFTAHSTNQLLAKLGIPVLEIPVATNIEDIRRNIGKVATALGDQDTGLELLERFDEKLAATSISPPPPKALAALYRENNILYGSNTVAGSFLRASGMENLADRLGLIGFTDLPLEILIEGQPDIVIESTGSLNAMRGVRAYRNLHHPVMAKLLEIKALVRVPDRLWACGSPAIVEAVKILAEAHLSWRKRNSPEISVHVQR